MSHNIYVSSSCIKSSSINDSVTKLAEEGFYNIELSGGTKYYDKYEKDLLSMQDKYGLSYIVHNYFPPPSQHFILNLSTLDDVLYRQSIGHCKRAIATCKKIGSDKYGVHAGFLMDFTTQEIGKKISYRALNDRKKSICRFSEALNLLQDEAGSDLKIYVENNVLSTTNLKTYDGDNPFLMTDHEGYMELKEIINFDLLLDLAHLKVSANSLGLDFKDEIKKLIPVTDYLHVSGNDGLHDQNLSLETDNELIDVLNNIKLTGKTITLEIYGGINSIVNSFEILKKYLQ